MGFKEDFEWSAPPPKRYKKVKVPSLVASSYSSSRATDEYEDLDDTKVDPGAIGFTSGFSQDSISITVGEQITVKQLIEKCIVMRISRHDHVYRHHVRNK